MADLRIDNHRPVPLLPLAELDYEDGGPIYLGLIVGEHGEFVGAPPGWELEPNRTAADMLRVMPDGVMWTAQPKHGDGEFETETVTWEQLEQVAAGGWPFEPAETSPEDDAGEDDDAD
jgi:hypothetical protein